MLLLTHLIPKCKDLLARMKLQGSTSFLTKRALRKVILTHSQDFNSFGVTNENLVNILTVNDQ